MEKNNRSSRPPVIRPTGNDASVYATEGPDDGNNGIDIVPANLNPTEPAFRYRPEGYEQWEFVGWDGNDRLLLKVTWRVGNDPELVTWPAEVVWRER